MLKEEEMVEAKHYKDALTILVYSVMICKIL